MVDFQCKGRYGWEDFLEITRLLRSPGGCPWDREQTHSSIRRNFLEETYEVLDALDRDDPHAMCEELGDLLMQVALHAQIEAEQGRFTMDDVVDGVAQKLVYRHPHVFGATRADTTEEVLVNWEALKRTEKGQRSTADAIESVPHTLPALWRAEKVVSKTAKAGFNWSHVLRAMDKLEEEAGELRQALESGGPADLPHGIQEELGFSSPPKSRRCPAWIRRRLCTWPATSLTPGSAAWRRRRASPWRNTPRRSWRLCGEPRRNRLNRICVKK